MLFMNRVVNLMKTTQLIHPCDGENVRANPHIESRLLKIENSSILVDKEDMRKH